MNQIASKIDEETKKTVAAFTIPQNIQAVNTPPSSGYRRQKVDTDVGSFMVDIISADDKQLVG